MQYDVKDMLEVAIDNNDSLWEFAVINRLQGELKRLYGQEAEYKEYRADTEKLYNALKEKGEKEIQEYKTKADEYEAKAKAFDKICKVHEPLEHRMSPVTVDEGLDFAEETEEIILKFYESGESDD